MPNLNLLNSIEQADLTSNEDPNRNLNLTIPRQKPNQKKVKVYFDKKGQQSNQFNDLMNQSFKTGGGGKPSVNAKNNRFSPYIP